MLDLKAQASDLNQQLKELKDKEDALRRSILLEMGGAKSVNLDGIARITRKDRTHYEIRNGEALAYAMLERMVANAKEGFPLAEGVLLQQRVAARALEEIMDNLGLDDAGQEAYLAKAGLAKVVEPTLSVTKN